MINNSNKAEQIPFSQAVVACWHSQHLQVGLSGNPAPTFTISSEKSLLNQFNSKSPDSLDLSTFKQSGQHYLDLEYSKSIHNSFDLADPNLNSLFTGNPSIYLSN